jgi:hypothetical protein
MKTHGKRLLISIAIAAACGTANAQDARGSVDAETRLRSQIEAERFGMLEAGTEGRVAGRGAAMADEIGQARGAIAGDTGESQMDTGLSTSGEFQAHDESPPRGRTTAQSRSSVEANAALDANVRVSAREAANTAVDFAEAVSGQVEAEAAVAAMLEAGDTVDGAVGAEIDGAIQEEIAAEITGEVDALLDRELDASIEQELDVEVNNELEAAIDDEVESEIQSEFEGTASALVTGV